MIWGWWESGGGYTRYREEELPTGFVVKDMAIVKRNDKISEQQSVLALSEGKGTVEQVWVKVLLGASPFSVTSATQCCPQWPGARETSKSDRKKTKKNNGGRK